MREERLKGALKSKLHKLGNILSSIYADYQKKWRNIGFKLSVSIAIILE